jgi:ABC-2 type transport system permease protein
MFGHKTESYRYMIVSLIKRELRGRYKGSVIGFIWNYIFPITQILVYYLVFSEILKTGIESYGVYLISGMVPWFFFSEAVGEGSGSFVTYSELVKKNYFPRYVIPLVTVTSKLVNFVIAYILGMLILVGFNYHFPITTLLVPVVVILLYLFALGLACALSAINVFLRDVQYMTNIILMILIWLSPILYMRDFIDNELVLAIIDLNPVSWYIDLFHELVYFGTIPEAGTWLFAILWSMAMIIIGYVVLKITNKRLAELL